MSLFVKGYKILTSKDICVPNENLLEKSSKIIMYAGSQFARGVTNKVPKNYRGSMFADSSFQSGINANGSRYFPVIEGKYYTQTIWLTTDAPAKSNNDIFMPFISIKGKVVPTHNMTFKTIGKNSYIIHGTFLAEKDFTEFDIGYVQRIETAFDFSQQRNMTIDNIKIEEGIQSTKWCPNPNDLAMQADLDGLKLQIEALKFQIGGVNSPAIRLVRRTLSHFTELEVA